MCGIHAAISKTGFQAPSEGLKRLLCNRGPDHTGDHNARIDSQHGTSYWITLMSTVLALRGGHVTAQPFLDASSGSALCWNGEAWQIGRDPVTGNDGQAVFDLVVQASSSNTLAADSTIAVLNVLQSISGPFAFVFLDKKHGQMYFGRDRLGRRSLVSRNDVNLDTLELSSIPDDRGSWVEVEADAIYQLSYHGSALGSQGLAEESIAPLHKHPWAMPNSNTSVSNLLGPHDDSFQEKYW